MGYFVAKLQLLGAQLLLPLDLGDQSFQRAGNLFTFGGLQNIFLRPQRERLLGIGKIIIGGKKDEPGIRQPLLQLAKRLQSADSGHIDVQNDDMWTVLLRAFNRLASVAGMDEAEYPRHGPLHSEFQPLSFQGLIIRNQKPVHKLTHLPFLQES
ncbi:hypothetical protein D3C75_800600 [compost metagenome]